MPQLTKRSLRQPGTLWLAMVASLALAVALVETVIRGHIEWVHVVGSSISIATAVVLASCLRSKK